MNRLFTKKGVPFFTEAITNAEIKGHNGSTIFKQENVSFPASFSQNAVNVVSSKYFYGDLESGERESSLRKMVDRVVGNIAEWGHVKEYLTEEQKEVFIDELTYILVGQYASFNSPVWFNVGLNHAYGITDSNGSKDVFRYDELKKKVEGVDPYVFPQASACFIIKPRDSIEGIWDMMSESARLFKFGSGVGADWSRLRSTYDKLSGGGRPSGPVSFMEVQDATAKTIKSGGKTRRAAIMQTLHDWHPDIQLFVNAKQNEEKKAWALIEQGYDGSFNGNAYGTVAFQNVNQSVRVSDEFMEKASLKEGGEYEQRSPVTDKVIGAVMPENILMEIAEGTHICGDPGVQYDGEIQRMHTCANTEKIWSSNPCSEYLFLDDTACNLASINLLKYLKTDGSFDLQGFEHTVDILIIAQDILVGLASYPSAEIAKRSYQYRTLGLGFANLGAFLMAKGVSYDSDQGRAYAGAITSLMTARAYNMSAELADLLEPFEGYEENSSTMNKVIDSHYRSSLKMSMEGTIQKNTSYPILISDFTLESANKIWERANLIWEETIDLMDQGTKFRNAQVTVLAPTGTISFMMDCDTTGIEPELALVKYKLLAGKGDGMVKMVNKTVSRGLVALDYTKSNIERIVSYISENDTIEGAPNLMDKDLPVFDCSFKPKNGNRSLNYEAHLKMMAACQPFISGAISKTVNLPETATVDDIYETYVQGWQLGLKAVAIYRENSKRSQPLNVSAETIGPKDKIRSEVGPSGPVRNKLPDERGSITHKFAIGGHEGYIHVGLYQEGHEREGQPGEIFITMSKQGSTMSGLMDAFATAISISLQYGVPLDEMVRKFVNSRYEPSGFTGNPNIPMATSITDYIFKYLTRKFVDKAEPKAKTRYHIVKENVEEEKVDVKSSEDSGLMCTTCGGTTIQSGNCRSCPNCGNTSGCG